MTVRTRFSSAIADLLPSAIVFAPREGMQIAGEVNQIGRDYVGLLVLGVFNASVPMAEVPAELQRRISVGTRLLIELTGIHVAHDRLSLSGSLLSPGTRIICSSTDTPKKKKKKNKRKESLSEDASKVAPTPSVKKEASTPQTEEKHKKKKAKKDKQHKEISPEISI